MKNLIYIVYEINEHQDKKTFCIKGLSIDFEEAKQFFKENKNDFQEDWLLIFGKVQDGNFDIFSNIINEIEVIEYSKK
jgi:hypothetical protein